MTPDEWIASMSFPKGAISRYGSRGEYRIKTVFETFLESSEGHQRIAFPCWIRAAERENR